MIKLCAFSDEAAKPIAGQIAAMKRNNIRLTEIRSVDGINVKKMTVEAAKEHQKALADAGIAVWAVGSPLGKVDINADMNEYLETVKHICNLANIFETDKIRMFSFFNAYGERNKVMENLNLMVECGKTFGVEMYHENEKDIYGDTAERVLDILDNVPGLKCVYDPANFLQCGECADYTLDKIHARTDYFHVKDVITETEQIVPAGHGDGKINEIISRISDDKVMTLEPHLKIFSGFGDIDSTQMKNKFCYDTNDQAFDAAVAAIKKLLIDARYTENAEKGIFVK